MSDDLTTGLRELAESGQRPPSVSGADVRRRAGARRRRRRTAAAVAGVSAVTTLAVALLVNLTGPDQDERPSPAATPTTVPSTVAAASATVDLTRRVLLIGGRQLPVSAGTVLSPTPTGRMTVTARLDTKAVPGRDAGVAGSYSVKIPWVIELRADDGRTTFLGGLIYDAKAAGNHDATNGWIGLEPAQAVWLYRQLRVGDVIDIEDGGPSPSALRTSEPGGTPEAGPPSSTPSVPGGPGSGHSG